MKKRTIALVCAAVMGLTMASCGPKVSTPQEDASTQAASSNETDVTTTPQEGEQHPSPEDCEALKDLYKDYFDIGTCISATMIKNKTYYDFILKNFSSVTCENNMKPEAMMNRYETQHGDMTDGGTRIVLNMENMRKELDFASQNGLKMRGHVFVWHEQTPDWIFYVNFDPEGELAGRELMLTRLENYMKDVFSWVEENYPGLFYAWDIANECMGDNNKMRDSLWYKTIGEDYVEQVFALARKYAPDYIKLFYNDYNESVPAKRTAIIKMLKPVAEAGNLDGMGMQAHLNSTNTVKSVVDSVRIYEKELGVTVHITELDYAQPKSADPETAQAQYYGQLFKELKALKDEGVAIESVTFWGINDGLSWRKDENPLLFNKDMTPKKAYYAVIDAAKN